MTSEFPIMTISWLTPIWPITFPPEVKSLLIIVSDDFKPFAFTESTPEISVFILFSVKNPLWIEYTYPVGRIYSSKSLN